MPPAQVVPVMPNRQSPHLLAWTVLLVLTPPFTARAETDLCDQAARIAAAEHSVPLAILQAITRVETAQGKTGDLRPWPWAINIAGQGSWPATRHQAETMVRRAIAQGKSSIDIGCFQLNLRWHGDAFPDLTRMFDPLGNARHAARFLAQLHRQSGDWRLATGRYHSTTPALAETYLTRIEDTATAMGLPVDTTRHEPGTGNRIHMFMVDGAPMTPGSLVPADRQSHQPPISLQPRRSWLNG